MKKFLKWALFVVFLLPAFALKAAEEPAISMRTRIYDEAGPNNACTIVLGGTPGTFVMVDCGFGPIEYELKEASFDSSSQAVKGTPISCQVSKEGIISIYPDDDATITYLDAEGCSLEWIKIADPSKIEILNLNHNYLSELDLSDFTALQIAYLTDNPYDSKPLTIGKNHPELLMLEINIVENIEPDFDIDTYPKLLILDAYAVPGIKKINPTNCPDLVRLSLDCTNISELDVTKNSKLRILNISETAVNEIDLSGCPQLQQLHCTHSSDHYNKDVKIKSLDLSNLPELYYLFATGNALTSIDVSKNPNLNHLWLGNNQLKELNIDNCPDIVSLHIENNYFDYVTLPAERETFIEYNYGQRPFEVPTQLEVGKPLDLSAKVNRPGTETYARLVSVKREKPYNPIEVDASKYTYANGILTVNQAISDSVYVEFSNTEFQFPTLNTTRFKVKKTADMGKPDVKMTFQPEVSAGATFKMSVGIEGASAETPKNVYVKQSDGSSVTIPVTASRMPAEPNVSFPALGWGQMVLSVDENERVSAIGVDDVVMYSCDVKPMSSLRDLRLTGAGLYALDLTYNRCLENLILTGNHFGAFNLDGVSGDYFKTKLEYLDLSDNEMTGLTISLRDGVRHFDVHNNKLDAFDFTDAENIEYLDISHNNLSTLKLNYQTNLTELNASYNNISEYVAPETDVIAKADFSHNAFTYASLPPRGNITEFTYAPQADIIIPTKAPGVDLSVENVTIDGKPVVFSWFKADGTQLAEGTDYAITEGRTRFINTTVGNIYCTLTCEALPDFSGENVLKTTSVTAAPMPTNVIATFTTAEAGTMNLSLGAHNYGSTIYIDWNGDGTDVVEYFLNDTYTLFEAQTKRGAEVKVLSYDENNDVRVFSIGGVKLSSFDASKLTRAVNISVAGGGLSEVILPESSVLAEIGLERNNLTEFDASRFPALRSISLSNNKLSSIDFSGCPNLLVCALARNQLTEVKFAPGNKVYFLDLTDNKLDSYDLQQHPAINQVGLAGNNLTEINPNNLSHLRTFAIENNRFTFATLPVPQEQWTRYTYANQAPVEPIINGLTVDLSSQKEVNGTPTVYRWFIGAPTYNSETGELEGEELVVNDEYTIENGITKLVEGYDHMLCVMTNTELPNVTLTTDFIDFAGIEAIEADGIDAEAKYYNLSGLRVEHPGKGIYIVVRGKKVTKEILK